MSNLGQSVSGPEFVARRFHEVYEELAPIYGYKTREESAVPWEDVPPVNKRLMVKVCSRLLHDGTIKHGKCRARP